MPSDILIPSQNMVDLPAQRYSTPFLSLYAIFCSKLNQEVQAKLFGFLFHSQSLLLRGYGMPKEKLFACDCGASFKTDQAVHEHHEKGHAD